MQHFVNPAALSGGINPASLLAQPQPIQYPAVPAQQQQNNTDEEAKYRQKYDETLAEVQELEKTNQDLVTKLQRSKRNLERLKFERRLLLDRLEKHQDPISTTANTVNGAHIPAVNISSSSNKPAPTKARKNGADQVEDDTGADSDATSASENVTSGVQKPRKRKKRDPNMPKRPPNAYLQWCNAERDRVKEQHPELSRTEISKFLSERWKTVTQEEKQSFYEQYEKDKVQYEIDMKKYTAGKEQSAEPSGQTPTTPGHLSPVSEMIHPTSIMSGMHAGAMTHHTASLPVHSPDLESNGDDSMADFEDV